MVSLRTGRHCFTLQSLLRSQPGQHFHVLALATVLLALWRRSSARLTPVFAQHRWQRRDSNRYASASCLAAAQPIPLLFAVLFRSRTGQNIHVLAFATMLLTRVSAFARFDEILYLVENASALTLPDFVRCDFLSQMELE